MASGKSFVALKRNNGWIFEEKIVQEFFSDESPRRKKQVIGGLISATKQDILLSQKEKFNRERILRDLLRLI